jgi:hypothetical protein
VEFPNLFVSLCFIQGFAVPPIKLQKQLTVFSQFAEIRRMRQHSVETPDEKPKASEQFVKGLSQ